MYYCVFPGDGPHVGPVEQGSSLPGSFLYKVWFLSDPLLLPLSLWQKVEACKAGSTNGSAGTLHDVTWLVEHSDSTSQTGLEEPRCGWGDGMDTHFGSVLTAGMMLSGWGAEWLRRIWDGAVAGCRGKADETQKLPRGLSMMCSVEQNKLVIHRPRFPTRIRRDRVQA